MRIPFLRALGLIVGTMCAFGAMRIEAQEFPSKPIRLISGSSTGSATDVTARILTAEMGKVLGQPIVVENRPGANFIVGFEYVAKNVPADGYTITVSSMENLASLPLTAKNLRFDPLKDLTPFVGYAQTRMVLSSSSLLPWKTFKELIAHARANPGKLNYGSLSATVLLPTEALVRNEGVNMAAIPYTPSSLYVALLKGEIDMAMLTEPSVISFGDKVRVFAITGDSRSPVWPDTPTFAELGHPSIRSLTFLLSAPSGVPRTVIDRLYAAASRGLQQPDLKAKFSKMGVIAIDETPEVTGKNLAEEAKFFADVAKKVGLKPE